MIRTSGIFAAAAFLGQLAVGSVATAQPAIETVSETLLTHGDSYTIDGTSFGTKPTAEPLSFDDFEDGALNDILGAAKIGRGWSHQASVENGLCNGDPCTNYSDEIVHSGSQSAKVVVDNYGFNFFGWTSSDSFGEIYIRYWRYFQPFVADLSNICNHKQFYIYNSNGDDPQWLLGAVLGPDQSWPVATQGACSTTFVDLAGIGRPTAIAYPEAPFSPGGVSQWKSWELYIRNDSPSSAQNGAQYMWLDGKLLLGHIRYSRPDYSSPNVDVTDRENVNLLGDDCPQADVYMQDVRIGAMVHNDDPCSNRAPPGQPDVTYLDDLYIDQTRARIEICDAATWNAKETSGALCEIQLPQVEWIAGSIQFQAHQGSLPSGEPLYLYVVDSTGAANEDGHAVQFGGGGSGTGGGGGGTGGSGAGGSPPVDGGGGVGGSPAAEPTSDDGDCGCRLVGSVRPGDARWGGAALSLLLLMAATRRRRGTP